jgi:hypothetical protein
VSVGGHRRWWCGVSFVAVTEREVSVSGSGVPFVAGIEREVTESGTHFSSPKN